MGSPGGLGRPTSEAAGLKLLVYQQKVFVAIILTGSWGLRFMFILEDSLIFWHVSHKATWPTDFISGLRLALLFLLICPFDLFVHHGFVHDLTAL